MRVSGSSADCGADMDVEDCTNRRKICEKKQAKHYGRVKTQPKKKASSIFSQRTIWLYSRTARRTSAGTSATTPDVVLVDTAPARATKKQKNKLVKTQ